MKQEEMGLFIQIVNKKLRKNIFHIPSRLLNEEFFYLLLFLLNRETSFNRYGHLCGSTAKLFKFLY